MVKGITQIANVRRERAFVCQYNLWWFLFSNIATPKNTCLIRIVNVVNIFVGDLMTLVADQ